MDPFTGVNVEDELEPLRPARTRISVGPSACKSDIAEYRRQRPSKVQMWKTYAYLTERRGEQGARIRR